MGRTEDGGQTWQGIYLKTDIISDVFFVNENRGWIGVYDMGNMGGIHYSNNGGKTWAEQFQLERHSTFYSVYFINPNKGWSIGMGGIFHTENGGETWVQQYSNTSSLSAIYFTNDNIGWAVGYHGTILKSVTGGAVSVKDEDQIQPQHFQLLQNYPNPFNPSTTIQYRLHKNGWVRLTIYNLNGQTVQTLVNEAKAPGAYAVLWDGTDNSGRVVSSGIYFYQLTMDDQFQETKKLVFLR